MTNQPQNLSGLKQYTFIFAYISLIRAGLSRANVYVCHQLKSAGCWRGSFLTLPCLPLVSEKSLGTAVQSRLCSVCLILQRVTLGMLLWWKPSSRFLSSFCLSHKCTFYWPNKQVHLTEPRAVTTSSVRGWKIGTISAITLPQCGGIIIWKWDTQVINYLAWIIFSMISVNLLSMS